MPHYGLLFTPDHLRDALKYREREPFKAAFAALDQNELGGIAGLVRAGLLWKLYARPEIGEAAVVPLERALNPSGDPSFLHTVGDLVALAQAFELLRDHPALEMALQSRWLEAFYARVSDLNTAEARDSLVERLWLAVLNTAAGVVLEQPPILALGVEVFQQVIREQVRPQGFIPQAVEGGDGGSMTRQILASSALTLIAEIAAHSDESLDLWSYAVRGVSATTAAIYPIYYFYTTEKWKWDTITVEQVQGLFRQYGGYLEIVHRRTGLKDVRTVLDDLRPILDVRGGGFTTLTHGVPVRKGLFG